MNLKRDKILDRLADIMQEDDPKAREKELRKFAKELGWSTLFLPGTHTPEIERDLLKGILRLAQMRNQGRLALSAMISAATAFAALVATIIVAVA
jgi:hypothetical protein